MKRLTCVCGLGFNFFSHGSQDLYPTFLQTTKGFDSYHSTVATIIGNCGAIVYACHFSGLAPFIPFANYYVCLPFLCQQWWRNCGRRVTVHRSPSHHHHLRCALWRIHPALDPPQLIQWTFCWRVLAAIWRAGCMGCHPDPTRGDEPARVSRDVPRCHLPTRKRADYTHHLWVIG